MSRRLRRQARQIAFGCTTLGLGAAAVPASAPASAAYPEAVLAEPGLVSYWRAAEGRGAARARDAKGDNGGRYRKGPRLRMPSLVGTKGNTAAWYDGADDHVTIPDASNLDFKSRFTLEAWVKPRSLRKDATILHKGNAYSLTVHRRSIRLAFRDRRGRLHNLVARRRLAARRRQHIAGSYRGRTLRLYVNGKLVKRRKLARRRVVRVSDKSLTIGGRLGSFRGVIDEVAVYRVALTAADVARHHRAAAKHRRRARVAPAPGSAAPAPLESPPAGAPGARPPSGTVLWNGDFETGDLRQYDAVQGVAPDRITLTGASLRKGRFATKMTALDGDTEISGNPRAQLMSVSQHFPGQEHFVGWSTLFPADFPAIPGGFMVFFQFHGKPWSGSPPLGWGVASDGRIELRRNGQYGFDRVWSMPLEKSRWVNFVARVKWSKNQSEGFVELWVDGVPQRFSNGQLRLNTQTVMDDQNEGLKTIPTNYRQKGIVPGAVTLYQDEVKVGTTYEAVAP